MEKNSVNNLDEKELKKRISNLERKVAENQKLRIKFADDATKFATSETELFSALDELQEVTTQPELYGTLMEKNVVKTLLSLISHENTDISSKVIVIIQELTDIEGPLGDLLDVVDNLLYELYDGNLFSLLVLNFGRLDYTIKEDAQIILASISIIENFIDYDVDFANKSYREGFGEWMLAHIKHSAPTFNSIKLAIGEMLSISVRHSGKVTYEFGVDGGFEILFQQIKYYRDHAPASGDEHEYLEQIISCLCEAITDCEENQVLFYREEGVDLIASILREKKMCVKKSNIKFGMLKLLNNLLTTHNNEDPTVSACCERFIEVLGLKAIFPIFNHPCIVVTQRIKRKEFCNFIDEVEEHSSGVLLALMKYCLNSEYLQRLIVKFSESDFEKLNRLIALHDKYFRLVTTNRDEFEANNPEPMTDWYDGDENKHRMLFVLRAVDYMILLCCYLGNKFETYDPSTGETFTNRICKILTKRPELRHQILIEAGKHSDEVKDSKEEQNSLAFLLEYFKEMNSEKKTDSV